MALDGTKPLPLQDIFGEAGPRMRRAGFAVLPANGKAPIPSGFTKWKCAPGPATVDKWAARKPGADVVYVPGLCRTARGGDPIVVVDGDNVEACGRVIELFGDTPGKVRTRRGRHYLYRHVGGESLGNIVSLKRFGIEGDLKHGRSIVAAPPSTHENDRSFSYAFDGCDESVIRDLPPFNVRALRKLTESREKSPGWKFQPNVTQTAPPPRPSPLYKGSRHLTLNQYLCGQASGCDTLDDLIDCAVSFNLNLVNKGFEAISPDKIIRGANVVWKDLQAGKLQHWHGARSVARTDADEVKDLGGRPHGGNALALLMLLRSEHQTRVLRGETFALDYRAMARDQVLPKWTIERYRNATRTLLAAGYIEVAKPGVNTRHGRKATQYTLVQRFTRMAA